MPDSIHRISFQDVEASYPPDTGCQDGLEDEKHSSPTKLIATRPLTPTTWYPEGGVEAWATVLGGFLLLASSFGWINSFSVFQTYYQR